jgi:hypothetical protein
MRAKAILIAAIVLLALATLWALRQIPAHHAPWAPLSLEDPVGFATSMKLNRLGPGSAQCSAALKTALQLRVRAAAPDAGANPCPLPGSFVIENTTIDYGQEMASSCALAAAIYVWEREVVQPAAQRRLGAPVVGIDTYGTFACRNVYNQQSGRRSEHASANALDVAGFRLADGRRITLLKGWASGDDTAAFLRDVRDNSCKIFNGVLGPDYNRAHADHFHLDMGPYRICQ